MYLLTSEQYETALERIRVIYNNPHHTMLEHEEMLHLLKLIQHYEETEIQKLKRDPK